MKITFESMFNFVMPLLWCKETGRWMFCPFSACKLVCSMDQAFDCVNAL